MDVGLPATSASARPATPRPTTACIPKSLVDAGDIDAATVDADGSVTLCLSHESLRVCERVARNGSLSTPDVSLAPGEVWDQSTFARRTRTSARDITVCRADGCWSITLTGIDVPHVRVPLRVRDAMPAGAAADGESVFAAIHDGVGRAFLERYGRDGARMSRAPLPHGPFVDLVRVIGPRVVTRSCAGEDACWMSIVDPSDGVTKSRMPTGFGRSVSPLVELAGDRVAFLDAAGTLTFVATDSGQTDGQLHVPDAGPGSAVLRVTSGEAIVLLSAPHAGALRWVDLTRAELGRFLSPPVCL